MITHLKTYNWLNAFRGMRNPKKSWNLNDSSVIWQEEKGEIPFIGPNDLDLAIRLIKGGGDERKFLRQIMISFDLRATLKFFDQFSQYNFIVTNSTSQMHMAGKFGFKRNDFYDIFESDLEYLNYLISRYQDAKDKNFKKMIWHMIIARTPQSYLYTRTVTMNYETFLNMYRRRRKHKLTEWREFCEILYNELPYGKEFVETILGGK